MLPALLEVDAAAAGRRLRDCVSDDGGSISILEGGTFRSNAPEPGHGQQDVLSLVDKAVLPPDDVAGRPPVPVEGVLGLRHQHRSEAGQIRRIVVEKHLELI
jgi:hypothetical protein